jgi:hypothetical protein
MKNWFIKYGFIWLASVGLAIGVLYYIYRKRQNMAQEQNYTEDEFVKALPKVLAKFGRDIARRVEQIYRVETAHFKSLQFRKTGSPGMEAHGVPPYYGWHVPFFVANPSYTPLGTFTMPENNTGISKTFIVMPSVEAAMMFLADYIKRHNNAARWYSTNPASQERYIATLNSVIPRHTNAIG